MKIVWLKPWVGVEEVQAGFFEAELRRELAPQHILYDTSVVAIGRNVAADDVLFRLQGHQSGYAVVHLTWKGSREGNKSFPYAELYADWEDFQGRRMSEDNYGYEK